MAAVVTRKLVKRYGPVTSRFWSDYQDAAEARRADPGAWAAEQDERAA